MFRHVLILAVSLQAAFCPVLCRTSHATTADCRLPGERSACATGHCCHAPADSHGCDPLGCRTDCESDDPPPASPCNCMGHVCVWSGAIVEKTDVDHLTLSGLSGQALPRAILLAPVTPLPFSFADSEAPPPISGRAVRALLCSLLC
ncbi:MAG: hypothetical protein HQ582_04755 [Planctomycetes bacterium]|nr:hypothetical protein [Planctomycetota bacterium]